MDISNSVISGYLARLRSSRNLSDHTIRAYRYDLLNFAKFASVSAQQSTAKQVILDYITHLSNQTAAPRTIRRRVACLKGFFRELAAQKLLEESPFDGLHLKLPRTKSLPRALSRSDAEKLAQAACWRCNKSDELQSQQFGAAVQLLLCVGLRVSEVVQLRPSDYEPQEGSLRVRGKGRRERKVFVVDQGLRAILADARRDGARPCLLGTNRPWTTQSFREKLHRFAKSAGVEGRVTPHMLRHTAATLLLEDGVDVLFLQRLLGHENIATTALYAHVGDASLRRALEKANLLASLSK